MSQPIKTMLMLTTEIVYAALVKVGPKHGLTQPDAVGVIGDALAMKVAEMVTMQHDKRYMYEFQAVDLETYLLFTEVLDEIQTRIPCVSRMNVVANVARLQAVKR